MKIFLAETWFQVVANQLTSPGFGSAYCDLVCVIKKGRSFCIDKDNAHIAGYQESKGDFGSVAFDDPQTKIRLSFWGENLARPKAIVTGSAGLVS